MKMREDTDIPRGEDRCVRIKDIVEIYKDPDTEQSLEGYAYVWEIMEKDENFFTLIVSFLGDPHMRKVPRKYKVRGVER